MIYVYWCLAPLFFNRKLVISQWPLLVVKATAIQGEKKPDWLSITHTQHLSHTFVSSTPRHLRVKNSLV
jgi:hypothetical protein